MIDAERALRAYTDVLTVEWDAEAGVARVVTISDVYYAVPSESQHRCPDREYHDPPDGACKHVVALEAVRGQLDVPGGWLVVEDLDERTDPAFDLEVPDRIGRNRTLGAFETDGGDEFPDFEEFQGGPSDPEPIPDGGQVVENAEWLVIDHDNDNERPAETREEAEDMAATAREFGSETVEIVAADETDDSPEVVAEVDAAEQETDVVPEREQVDAELTDRGVSDDPIRWLEDNGDHFVDYVGEHNTPAINRKGFEVLSHFYDIDVHADLQVPPEDTDFKFVRVKATATTPEGRECQAFGSAHVDRGDDPELLLEMADTRARKRALSIATGVGAVAVAELKNEVRG